MNEIESRGADDTYALSRFVRAQANDFEQALSEIKAGQKRTHWMWYLFPQLDGLAFSSTSRHYSIKSIEEAQAYLKHPVLGPRLLECAEAVVQVEGRSAREIFGSPDDMKLRSCATLFAKALPPGSVGVRPCKVITLKRTYVREPGFPGVELCSDWNDTHTLHSSAVLIYSVDNR